MGQGLDRVEVQPLLLRRQRSRLPMCRAGLKITQKILYVTQSYSDACHKSDSSRFVIEFDYHSFIIVGYSCLSVTMIVRSAFHETFVRLVNCCIVMLFAASAVVIFPRTPFSR